MGRKAGGFIFKLVLTFTFVICTRTVSFSQINDTTRIPLHFGVAAAITNKGISTIPNLTLGKPAAIFDLTLGKKNLSFEPQFRFALEGKPWSFLFWWRYKLIQSDKIRLNIGAHPALSFKTKVSTIDGISTINTSVYRYLAGEIVPVYFISKNVSVGTYYLYSRGIDKILTRNTNQVALRANFNNIKISKKFFLGVYPQAYFLKMDDHQGYYLNSTFTMGKTNLPVTLSALVNKRITSDLPGDNDFIWNISLKYIFNKDYFEK